MIDELDQLSQRFMEHLKGQLDDPSLNYAIPLTPVQGGFETRIFRFQLTSDLSTYSAPWVLRLYPERYGAGNAVWESTVQNTLAGEGYPVPKCHLLCTDISILGGAFVVMDYLPGEPLATAPGAIAPTLLGQSQAALHSIDPVNLIEALDEQPIDRGRYRLDNRFANLMARAASYPWLGAAVDWLVANRPPEPERLAICHGDFHPFNILVRDGKVTAVLDWPGFVIADPALDVATTLVLLTIPVKHLAPIMGFDLSADDINQFVEIYLQAYQAEKSLDTTHLDYYRARRCVHALLEGAEGQESWRLPELVDDLVSYVHQVTGLRLTTPT